MEEDSQHYMEEERNNGKELNIGKELNSTDKERFSCDFSQIKGGKSMDIIMIAVLAVSFYCMRLLVGWCEHQVEKQ